MKTRALQLLMLAVALTVTLAFTYALGRTAGIAAVELKAVALGFSLIQ